MEERGLTKQEVEEAIKGKDYFVKIDYLNRFLKRAGSLEMKKFVLLNLASVNEEKGLLNDAIKNVEAAADICVTFREKIELYMKETELWVKIGDFHMSEKAFQKAYFVGNSQEKLDMSKKYLNLFRAFARDAEEQGKTRKALDYYEKLFNMKQDAERKADVKEKLIEIYDKLGRMKDAEGLRNKSF